MRFHAFFKAIGAHGPCFVNFEGDPGDGWARINLPRQADYDWTEVTGVVTVKPPSRGRDVDQDGNVRIYVFIYTKAFGELWIDDVTLTPVLESFGRDWPRRAGDAGNVLFEQRLYRLR